MQGAAVGYNPTKHGRASYHPILVFDGISRVAIRAELRPGNAVAATDALSVLDRSLEDVTKTGAKVIGFRGDRGFQGKEIFKHLEGLRIDYAIKTAVDRKLADWAADLTFQEIGLDGDDLLEAVEGIYQRSSWSRPRRVVCLRKRIASGLCAGATYDQQAIVTTLTADPEDVYHFYNQAAQNGEMYRTPSMDLPEGPSSLRMVEIPFCTAIAQIIASQKLN
ncbi:MAG: transposase [Thermaerobacter sp.]|nr:transposase [Thermaerobacter sp.]